VSLLAVDCGLLKASRTGLSPSLIESGRELDPPTFALGFAAHILRGLEMPELVQVVQFAASLMPPDSEYAMWATYSRGNVFGERE